MHVHTAQRSDIHEPTMHTTYVICVSQFSERERLCPDLFYRKWLFTVRYSESKSAYSACCVTSVKQVCLRDWGNFTTYQERGEIYLRMNHLLNFHRLACVNCLFMFWPSARKQSSRKTLCFIVGTAHVAKAVMWPLKETACQQHKGKEHKSTGKRGKCFVCF